MTPCQRSACCGDAGGSVTGKDGNTLHELTFLARREIEDALNRLDRQRARSRIKQAGWFAAVQSGNVWLRLHYAQQSLNHPSNESPSAQLALPPAADQYALPSPSFFQRSEMELQTCHKP